MPPAPIDSPRTPSLILLLAVTAGVSVASLYYNQPILGRIADEFHAGPELIGRLPMWTQIGYAAGILLLNPLADRIDRRQVILSKMVLLSLGLMALGFCRSLQQVTLVSFLVGGAASLAQDCVPAAATLARDEERGKVVGSVMTGLLLGILLSRTISGFVAEHFGWRSVFISAALVVAALTAVTNVRLPKFAPSTQMGYTALLGSLGSIFAQYSELRKAAAAQLLLSSAFSAFWSTLALMLREPPFNYGSGVAGLFGLAGAAGAFAARVGGAIADRRGPEAVVRTGALLVLACFVGFAIAPANLPFLIFGTVLFDLGLQACVVAHQSIIYALDPNARSRINAVFIGGMFVGMAVGSYVGSLAFAWAGWRGVSLYAALAALGALLLRVLAPLRAVAPKQTSATPSSP